MSDSARLRARPRRNARGIAVALAIALAVAVLALGGWSEIARALGPPAPPSSFDGPVAPCRIADTLTPHREPSDWARTLLDHEYTLAPDDTPPDLVELKDHGIPGNGSIRRIAVASLAAMSRDARAAGSPFRVESAYRSYARQERTFDSLVAAHGRDEALRSAARPGHSEHQLGTTIDVDGGEPWLAVNAHRYGFVMSYPPEHSPHQTCYKPEPWHYRYVGEAAAREIRAFGESLRAWLWRQQDED
jgi:D-alanyl-D-alanine carboxypeptidase